MTKITHFLIKIIIEYLYFKLNDFFSQKKKKQTLYDFLWLIFIYSYGIDIIFFIHVI